MSSATWPIPDWLTELSADAWSHGPALGTVERIDDAARARAIDAVTEFKAVTIGRPLVIDESTMLGSWSMEKSLRSDGNYTSAYDHFEIDSHGLGITHLDALNHFGVDRQWYQGKSADSEDGVSLGELAMLPIVTRCVFLDLAEARGKQFIDRNEPVGAADLDRALEIAGSTIEPGDALLLYMGRDEFESAGGYLKPILDSPEGRPGVGESGSQWIGNTKASLVAWDLNDAHGSGELRLSVHLLSWAIGLLLIDNCDFSALRHAIGRKKQRTGLLTVCPLKIRGATGCAVNPVVMV